MQKLCLLRRNEPVFNFLYVNNISLMNDIKIVINHAFNTFLARLSFNIKFPVVVHHRTGKCMSWCNWGVEGAITFLFELTILSSLSRGNNFEKSSNVKLITESKKKVCRGGNDEKQRHILWFMLLCHKIKAKPLLLLVAIEKTTQNCSTKTI